MIDRSDVVKRALSSRSVLIIGQPDTGKTTFFGALRDAAQEIKSTAGFIDGDLGQKIIGPPCTVGLEIPHESHSSLYFVGDTTPAQTLLEAVLGVGHLEKEARACGCKTVVVDTSGLAAGGLGARLKTAKAELVDAELAILFERKGELAELAALLETRGISVDRIPIAPQVRITPTAVRAENRRLRYLEYFKQAAPISIKRDQVVVFPSEIPARWPTGLLLGMLDEEWSTLAMGMLAEATEKELIILTPSFPLEKLKLIKAGRIILGSDGREVGRVK